MPHITDIPVDTILDNLLPCIAVPDLLHLARTNRFFATLLADELFWKRKIKDDFNFTGAGTSRTTNWKPLYRGLRNPKVYVWGEKSMGRLGLKILPKSIASCVPFPIELHIPGVRIVNLISGGMSFHALGSEGEVYVWGTLDGNAPMPWPRDGYSEPSKPAYTPLKLALPTPTRTISCGRLHASSLDANNHVWIFICWGRPFRLVSSLVDNSSEDSTPIQVECGWAFSAVLTKSGNVFVWQPGGRMYDIIRSRNQEMDREGDKQAHATEDGAIPCVTWDLEFDPIRLPELPQLSKLHHTGEHDSNDEEVRLIQIAGLDEHLVGLTNHGHVLKITVDDDSPTAQRTWQYLPRFSEVERVREHPAFSSATLEPLEDMHITHITANFQTFVAYSTGKGSIVLMGKTDTNVESTPIILPALQHRSIISVVIGDYHNAALTSDGTLLTWGQYSNGALGLGDPSRLKPGTPGGFQVQGRRGVTYRMPPAVSVPTEVRFSNSRKKAKDMFCFAAVAAGWHTGALVIDLNPNAKDIDVREEEVEEEDDDDD